MSAPLTPSIRRQALRPRGSASIYDIQGTAWAALQAFSEWADHHRHTRAVQGKKVEVMRLESIWMGKAAAMKRQALAAIADTAQLRLAA
ncbi:DUF932 domain-containing protein [Archangium violaceum]|nr:DUF932 domain-containing protein [Archangium violaceum]